MPDLAERLARDKQLALAAYPVSRETEARLDRLVAQIVRWQAVKNLVAREALAQLWSRHVVDSLQLVSLAEQPRLWLDLGSGGGFPGLVVAAVLAERDTACIVHLVESNARKCAFLREAARLMSLRVEIHAGRIEQIAPAFAGRADVVSARALASLPQLIGWTEKLLTTGAVGLFPKGRDVARELTETAKYWRLEYTRYNSLTDPEGCILRITKAERNSPEAGRAAGG